MHEVLQSEKGINVPSPGGWDKEMALKTNILKKVLNTYFVFSEFIVTLSALGEDDIEGTFPPWYSRIQCTSNISWTGRDKGYWFFDWETHLGSLRLSENSFHAL